MKDIRFVIPRSLRETKKAHPEYSGCALAAKSFCIIVYRYLLLPFIPPLREDYKGIMDIYMADFTLQSPPSSRRMQSGTSQYPAHLCSSGLYHTPLPQSAAPSKIILYTAKKTPAHKGESSLRLHISICKRPIHVEIGRC